MHSDQRGREHNRERGREGGGLIQCPQHAMPLRFSRWNARMKRIAFWSDLGWRVGIFRGRLAMVAAAQIVARGER